MTKGDTGSSSPAKKADKPKKEKAAKAPKEKKEKVLRPLNAYMRFAQEERSKVAKANPGWQVTDVAKELGKRYKQLSESEKDKYKALAQKEFDAKHNK